MRDWMGWQYPDELPALPTTPAATTAALDPEGGRDAPGAHEARAALSASDALGSPGLTSGDRTPEPQPGESVAACSAAASLVDDTGSEATPPDSTTQGSQPGCADALGVPGLTDGGGQPPEPQPGEEPELLVDWVGAELAVGLATPDGEPAERRATGCSPGPAAAAPSGAPTPGGVLLRNCWTCREADATTEFCARAPYDQRVNDWARATDGANLLICPPDADGCPGWAARETQPDSAQSAEPALTVPVAAGPALSGAPVSLTLASPDGAGSQHLVTASPASASVQPTRFAELAARPGESAGLLVSAPCPSEQGCVADCEPDACDAADHAARVAALPDEEPTEERDAPNEPRRRCVVCGSVSCRLMCPVVLDARWRAEHDAHVATQADLRDVRAELHKAARLLARVGRVLDRLGVPAAPAGEGVGWRFGWVEARNADRASSTTKET